MKLSSYAFNNYGGDAKLYNGIHDLESDLEAMRSVYREKNPCGHYKRFQIVDTDPESACAACEIDRICREYSDLEAQLEAMRAEKEKDRLRLLFRDKVAKSMNAELDRLRKALGRIAKRTCAVGGCEEYVPENLCSVCTARRVLNPQPAESNS